MKKVTVMLALLVLVGGIITISVWDLRSFSARDREFRKTLPVVYRFDPVEMTMTSSRTLCPIKVTRDDIVGYQPTNNHQHYVRTEDGQYVNKGE